MLGRDLMDLQIIHQDLNNLECGLYDVTVTDPLGCNSSYSHNIPCPSPISVTLIV